MKKINLTIALVAILLINAKANMAQNLSFREQLLEALYGDESYEPQRYEDEGNEDGFFNDMNQSRFASSYKSSYERTDYRIENRRNFDFNRNTPSSGYNFNEQSFDFSSPRNYGNGGGAAGAGGFEPVTINPGNSAGTINQGGSIGIAPFEPPKRRDVTPENSPGLPGDPDVPVDGGIVALLAAGAAYGAKRKFKKNNKNLHI
ncbi:MAG: PID-CTERM protein-sorting domain-containing protein [Bacteroidia bacterium]